MPLSATDKKFLDDHFVFAVVGDRTPTPPAPPSGPKPPRLLAAIARDIKLSWPKVYLGAVPYLDAMLTLGFITDTYGADDARSIVTYFLSNARSWRGDDAKRLKAELIKLMKGVNG